MATVIKCHKIANIDINDVYQQVLRETQSLKGSEITESVLAHRHVDAKERESLAQYFGGAYSALRMLNLSGKVSKLPRDLRSARRALGRLQHSIEAESAAYKMHFEKYGNVNTRWMEAEIAAILLRNDIAVSEEAFHLTAPDLKSAVFACKQTVSRQRQIAEKLEPMEAMGMRRLALALSLLEVPEIANLFPQGESWPREVAQLRVISRRLARLWPSFLEFRNYHTALELTLQNLKDRNTQSDLMNAIQSIMGMVAEKISALHKALWETPYPFDDATKGISVAHYILDKLPANDDLGGISQAGNVIQERLVLLATRTAGRLAYIATNVEKAIAPVAESMPQSTTNTASSMTESATKSVTDTVSEKAPESREKKPNPFLGNPEIDLSTDQ